MKKTLKQTTEFFADTLIEAEGIVTDMKDSNGSAIVNHSITRKEHKKTESEYFIVKVTVEHMKAKDILEGE